MAIRHDLDVNQGASWSTSYTHRDSAGAVVDLTGYTARMMIKSSFATGYQAFLSSDAPAGGTVTLGGATGEITLTMTAAQTDLIASEVQTLSLGDVKAANEPSLFYLYDLEIEAPGGTVTRVLQGRFILHKAVTR